MTVIDEKTMRPEEILQAMDAERANLAARLKTVQAAIYATAATINLMQEADAALKRSAGQT